MNSTSTDYHRFTDSDEIAPRDIPLQDEAKQWDHYQNISAGSMKDFPTTFDEGHFFLCPPSIGGFLTQRREFCMLPPKLLGIYRLTKAQFA